MPYLAGSAANPVALAAALKAAAVANGWTAHGTDVVSNGAGFVSIVGNNGTTTVTVVGGTGVDMSNVLTGVAPSSGRIGPFNSFTPTFPVTYEIFIGTNPKEVYMVINHDTNYYQFVSFGMSDVPGLPGTGCWFGGSFGTGTNNGIFFTTNSGGAPTAGWYCGMHFGMNRLDGSNAHCASSIHHGFTPYTWSDANPGNIANALLPAIPRYARQPNTFNGATALIDYKVFVERGDQKVSLVADFAHSRLLRIDNYAPGDIITLGSDQWKVYPWLKKNTSARNGGGAGVSDTGTMGWAVRYDGP